MPPEWEYLEQSNEKQVCNQDKNMKISLDKQEKRETGGDGSRQSPESCSRFDLWVMLLHAKTAQKGIFQC